MITIQITTTPNDYYLNDYYPNDYCPNDYHSNDYYLNDYYPNDYYPNDYCPTDYCPTDYCPTNCPRPVVCQNGLCKLRVKAIKSIGPNIRKQTKN
jgi:hypothetical protein